MVRWRSAYLKDYRTPRQAIVFACIFGQFAMRKFVQIVEPVRQRLERLLECPLTVAAPKKQGLPAVAAKDRDLQFVLPAAAY